jgi:hypothetical protein
MVGDYDALLVIGVKKNVYESDDNFCPSMKEEKWWSTCVTNVDQEFWSTKISTIRRTYFEKLLNAPTTEMTLETWATLSWQLVPYTGATIKQDIIKMSAQSAMRDTYKQERTLGAKSVSVVYEFGEQGIHDQVITSKMPEKSWKNCCASINSWRSPVHTRAKH